MASKKTSKKKARKKGRTAAQKAATAKLVALNKDKKKGSKKTSKKSRKKSRKKSSKKGGWRQHSVGRRPAYQGGAYNPHARYKPSIGEQFAGEKGGQHFHGPMSPTQALVEANLAIERLQRVAGGGVVRRTSKKRSSKSVAKHSAKHGGVVTAASILRGAKSDAMKVYVCAGKRFSGCGGGKRGSHVVGHLRG